MRTLPFILFSVLTVALVYILNTSQLTPVPFGEFLSPQHGFWQNADASDKDYNEDLVLPELKNETVVYFDNRLVPHVFAQNEADALFTQGFLHAKFRLWQMEFQIRAASGRLSEIVGKQMLSVDRNMRRLGMVYGAEKSLKEIENDPESLTAINSYTAGVNAYIATLNSRNLPFEYKLLGYQPEKWSNLKSALFMKLIALDLAGFEQDFEMTNARTLLTSGDFDKIYPIIMDSLSPIVPKGTEFMPPRDPLLIPGSADSLYFTYKNTNNIEEIKPNPDNGSNNWAVSGEKTASGAPILCNDPHLGLNLPSLWYEMQITTPEFSAYGATFPGAPYVIIGFNENIAFGFTNGMRDVRDYYKIKFKDESRKEYWFDSSWNKTSFRIEEIKTKDAPVFYDTVAYTNIGPVMYDKTYTGGRNTGDADYAVRWKANDPSNELKLFYYLDRAKNYSDYLEAVKNLHTPGQNIVFASREGDIAIWAQGQFPAKWYRQGDFVMPGDRHDYQWQYNIPQEQNPHLINPERGFVSSANQMPADTAYPYYLGGIYPPYRGYEINRKLSAMNNITPEDMMKLQTENFNVFAEMLVPEIVSRLDVNVLNKSGRKYYEILKDWDFVSSPDSRAATIFDNVYDTLYKIVWGRVLPETDLKIPSPQDPVLVDIIKRGDSSLNILANLTIDINDAFKRCVPLLKQLEKENKIQWAAFKDTEIGHLLKLSALSVKHVNIGGGTHIINATTNNHGPSWRMVVSLTDQIDAYGIYPGGQEGNPGSKYYDNFIDKWAQGKYYKLWLMKPSETSDGSILFKMNLRPKHT